MDIEGIFAIVFLFGGGTLFLLSISPIGKAVADRIRGKGQGGDVRAELADWVARPAAPEATRSELAVKIRAASYGDAGAVVDEVRRHRALRAERLEFYLANEKREFPDPSRLRGARLHQWLVLRGGIALEQGLLDWDDEVLATLSRKRPT